MTVSEAHAAAAEGATRPPPNMSSFVGKFRASGDQFQQSSLNKVSKRNRQPLSCGPCRSRKLRCDRQHPCETCVKRNDESSCTYARTSPPKDNVPTRVKAQDRLRNLEDLVLQMVETNSAPTTLTDSQTASASAPPSSFSVSNGTPQDGSLNSGTSTTKYVGSTHWSAIMENIQELKSAMVYDAARSIEVDIDEEQTSDSDILFGSRRSIPLNQILTQHLPSRLTIDRLLATYFNAKYMVIPYIHTYQFQRQYEQFWNDHSAVSPQWVSILFSICCLATQLTQAVGGDTPGQDSQSTSTAAFLTASAQCLVLAGYTKPKPNLVEALALYAQCKYNTSLDPSGEVGILFATLIRLAYQMAYHRDADNFSQISVFEGEMRRRVWTMCRQFDLMVSFQLGLPNNIPLDSWDTKSPRNLLDSDFDENTTVLPPSRPEHEPTQILYFIVKSRLMTNFGKICNHALSFKNSSQDEIMDLDAQVRATFSQVPNILRIRPMSQSLADPPYLLMVRLNCAFLYQKSILVLHRKYMTQGFDNSTKACLDAAMSIIESFADINKEFRPGGFLYNDRWMLTSFTMNDFLLAAMILCLAVSQWRKKNPHSLAQQDEQARRHLDTLRVCHDICQERAPTSVESRKVAGALRTMLNQIEPQATPSLSTLDHNPRATPASLKQQLKPKSSTTSAEMMDLTPLTFEESPIPQSGSGDPFATADLGPFENFLDGSENIDWTFLDQYLVDPNRYNEALLAQGIGTQGISTQNGPQYGENSGQDGLSDWNSEPYRFLGRDGRTNQLDVSQPGFDPGPQQTVSVPLQPPGARNLHLRTAGPENGYMPGY